MEIETGHVVRLRSGGPKMIVWGTIFNSPKLLCFYFDKKRLRNVEVTRKSVRRVSWRTLWM